MAKCKICDNYSRNGHLFCKDCYQDAKDYIDELWENYESKYDLEKHYFNIKNMCLYNYIDENKLDNSILKMYALARICTEQFENDYLENRVEEDIEEMIIAFNEESTTSEPEIIEEIKTIKRESEQIKTKTNKKTFNDIDFRKRWPRKYQCSDGHYVRSLSETNIDNWLYSNNIVHAYEKSVYMATNPDAVVLSDFYIPQGNVYIEFWGIEDKNDKQNKMKVEEYEARKQEKIKLYDDNKYSRIDLFPTDIERLDDILPRKLGKYLNKK